jgi:uncharacterized protein (DUF1919 family)
MRGIATAKSVGAAVRRKRSLRRLDEQEFSIVSSNCWGSTVYQDLGLPYRTPFVGLFLHAPCFLRLCTNLHETLATPVVTCSKSRYVANPHYPVGMLGDDIELHFLHYTDFDSARERWEGRLARLRWDRLAFSMTDRDEATAELLTSFDGLPFARKVLFTANPHGLACEVSLPEYRGEPFVGDLYTNRRLVRSHFDSVSWLNT